MLFGKGDHFYSEENNESDKLSIERICTYLGVELVEEVSVDSFLGRYSLRRTVSTDSSSRCRVCNLEL